MSWLEDFVRENVKMEPGQMLHVISSFSVLLMLPDGSAQLFKSAGFGLQTINLSRHDIEFMRTMRMPVRMFTPGPEADKDVHTEHCCVLHGCKYGDEDCPVVKKTKYQSFACPTCYYEATGEII